MKRSRQAKAEVEHTTQSPTASSLHPAAKLAVLVKRSRQAKAEVERALGAKLGRRVNIQGEINQLLAG